MSQRTLRTFPGSESTTLPSCHALTKRSGMLLLCLFVIFFLCVSYFPPHVFSLLFISRSFSPVNPQLEASREDFEDAAKIRDVDCVLSTDEALSFVSAVCFITLFICIYFIYVFIISSSHMSLYSLIYFFLFIFIYLLLLLFFIFCLFSLSSSRTSLFASSSCQDCFPVPRLCVPRRGAAVAAAHAHRLARQPARRGGTQRRLSGGDLPLCGQGVVWHRGGRGARSGGCLLLYILTLTFILFIFYLFFIYCFYFYSQPLLFITLPRPAPVRRQQVGGLSRVRAARPQRAFVESAAADLCSCVR